MFAGRSALPPSNNSTTHARRLRLVGLFRPRDDAILRHRHDKCNMDGIRLSASYASKASPGSLLPRSLILSALPVFLVTSIVWIYGVSRHTFLAQEIGIYIGIFLIPGAAICTCIWLIFQKRTWARVVGLLLIVPSFAVWAVSLLLVANGFRIH